MTKVPSFTFAGGVLSRALWGRFDLNKYQTGLKYANNAMLSVEGGVGKRWGTYFTGKRKLQTAVGRAKLIPWRIADNDSYMLEFGDYYIRFIRLGGYVTIPGGFVHHADNQAANVGGVMEIETPWTAEQAWEIKYTFANDIMYIAHKDVRPHELRRLGLYDWHLTMKTFNPHPDWPVTDPTATYFDDTTADDNYDAEPVGHRYKVSVTYADGIESKPSSSIFVAADLGHRRTRVELDWPNVTDAIQYTVYKGGNGIFGFIGYTTTSEFTDRNYAPSYDVVPVGNRVGFESENPSIMEFYKQRMAYASTESNPQDMWFSRPYIFSSLAESVPLQEDDAFRIQLVARQRQTINHMVMLKRFLIFTDSAEWTLNTIENRALSLATADPVVETQYGAKPNLRPIVVGNRILFVQNKTGAVLDMGYEFTADAFKADELTRLSRDLFKNKEIVAWDYAVHPHNLLFCVMSDGTLNIMTYVREHEIWGWTSSNTQGKFLDVACVTEIDHEGVYFQVERVIDGVTTYFIERFNVDLTGKLQNMVFSDCAISYVDGRAGVAHSVTPGQVLINTTGLTAGKRVRIERSATEHWIGLVSSVSGGTAYISPGGYGTTSFSEEIAGDVEVLIMTDAITGLDHLNGETVWALIDGKVLKDIVLTDGTFTPEYPAARIHIGLPFFTRVETLDMDADAVKGQFREKTIHEISINVQDSRSVFIGVEHADFPMEKITPRDSDTNMHDANAPLNGTFDLRQHISWKNTTEIIIESNDPLPMNILNIAPDIRYASS